MPPLPKRSVLGRFPNNHGHLGVVCERIRRSTSRRLYATFDMLTKAYRLGGLQRELRESGPTARPLVGIVMGGWTYSNRGLAAFRKCTGLEVQAPRVRSGRGDVTYNAEGDLDTQTVFSVLGAREQVVPVFQTISGGQTIGLRDSPQADTSYVTPYLAALNTGLPPTAVTTSSGTCEYHFTRWRGAPIRRLADAVFVRLGLAGTSVLFASGDQGSSACAHAFPPTAHKALLYPGT